MNDSWYNNKTKDLFAAFLKLKTENEVASFCRDLMTVQELETLADRWQVAQRLDEGLSQRKVVEETGVSIATVTRVNNFLTRGMNGYRKVLDRLNHHHPH